MNAGQIRRGWHEWPAHTPLGLLRGLTAMEREIVPFIHRNDEWAAVGPVVKRHTRALKARFPNFAQHLQAMRLGWVAHVHEECGDWVATARVLRARLALPVLRSAWRGLQFVRLVDALIALDRISEAQQTIRRGLRWCDRRDPDLAARLRDRLERLGS